MQLPWYSSLSAQQRSWVGLIIQTGLAQFITWCERDSSEAAKIDLFSVAPAELTGQISLAHTLELLRTAVDVVEARAGELSSGQDPRELVDNVLRYSRDIAFQAAVVYARAAEQRGAWDARIEAMVIDSLIRGDIDDSLRSQVAALGWTGKHPLMVVVGSCPDTSHQEIVDQVHRFARRAAVQVVVGVHAERLVVVLADPDSKPLEHLDALVEHFAPGPVVVGPVVPSIDHAAVSSRAALAGLHAVRGWPGAPRPVFADDLLPERMLARDHSARHLLLSRIYQPMVEAGGQELISTVATYLESGREIAEAARLLFVHANTVRYRLKRVTELTGLNPLNPRDGMVLHVAIVAGRLAEPHEDGLAISPMTEPLGTASAFEE